jgi:hypothetical protein
MTPTQSKAKCKRQRDNWKRRCEAAESALKVLHTWATFRGGSMLSPLSVSILCKRTLEENRR